MRYFEVTEFNNCFIIRSLSLFLYFNDYPAAQGSDQPFFSRELGVTMSAINCSAGLAVVVVNLDFAVAEIVPRSWEDLSTTCDERCAVCTGL